MERYNPEQMRQHLYGKAEKLFRAKAKLVKIFGKYYYKSMEEAEFK